MSKTYYNQADSRWATHPYPATPGYENATIKSSGCGVACASMVVSSFKEIITPDTMGDISMANGYRVPGGTKNDFFEFVANKWGLQYERLHSSYTAHEYCKNGWFVVMLCANGLWTTGGHFIVAVGANDNEIEIYDPYYYANKYEQYGRSGKVRIEGNSAWVQIDTFKANSNVQALFAMKLPDGQAPIEEKTEPVVFEKTKYVNTNSLPLNVRNAPNGNIVGQKAKGTQVTVYEEKNNWSRIGNGEWVSSDYLSDNKPIENNRNTVGQMRKLVDPTILYSNSDLTGTKYNYKANTTVKILENVSADVDKIFVPATNRTAYVKISAYGGNETVNTQIISNTVGQIKRFKGNTTIYSNSDLSGVKYQYKGNTSVQILQNVSTTVDKIKVRMTGRIGYVKTENYM